MAGPLTAPKVFFATFLAILSAAATIGVAVYSINGAIEYSKLQKEIRSELFDSALRTQADKSAKAYVANDQQAISEENNRLKQISEARDRGDSLPPNFDSPSPSPVATINAPVPGETPQMLRLIKPVDLKDTVGHVIAKLPIGQSLQYTSRDDYQALVRYQGEDYEVRIADTDLK